MKALIDTNVLIDFLAIREPFFADADRIITACRDMTFQGCIAAHSVPDCFYLLRKNPLDERRIIIKSLCQTFDIVGLDSDKISVALDNFDFKDFEDCLQSECAADYGAEYIVTRNTKDFDNSKVKAITPAEFLQLLSPNNEEQ